MITSKLNPQVKTCGYALLPLRGILGDLQTTKRTDGILPQNTVAFRFVVERAALHETILVQTPRLCA